MGSNSCIPLPNFPEVCINYLSGRVPFFSIVAYITQPLKEPWNVESANLLAAPVIQTHDPVVSSVAGPSRTCPFQFFLQQLEP